MGVKCGKETQIDFLKIENVVILSLSGSQENCQEISRSYFTPKIRNYILHKCWTEIKDVGFTLKQFSLRNCL